MLLFLTVMSASKAEGVFFEQACAQGTEITITAGGDILLHNNLQLRAAEVQDFSFLWEEFTPYFDKVDLSYLNFEGTAAEGIKQTGKETQDPGFVFDNRVYTSYPQFNYHPQLVADLVKSGVDIVSTANNHSMDRRTLGVERTIDALEKNGLRFMGTRRVNESRPWYSITETKGIRIAWISCTYDTNGIPDPNKQVLRCFEKEDKEEILQIIAEQKQEVDAVIVTPHWGFEYKTDPNPRQKGFAKELLEAGALAVLGGHPHVLQPMERHVTKDGRETFIIYSLGNFVSGQTSLKKRATVLLFLGLVKNEDGVFLQGVRYLPGVMDNRRGRKNLSLRIPEFGGFGSYALRHIVSVLSWENRLYPDEELIINPHCHHPKICSVEPFEEFLTCSYQD